LSYNNVNGCVLIENFDPSCCLLRDGFIKPIVEVRWKISWLLLNVKLFVFTDDKGHMRDAC